MVPWDALEHGTGIVEFCQLLRVSCNITLESEVQMYRRKGIGNYLVLGEAKNRKLVQSEKQRYSHRPQLRQRNGISGGLDREEHKNTGMGSLRAIMERLFYYFSL